MLSSRAPSAWAKIEDPNAIEATFTGSGQLVLGLYHHLGLNTEIRPACYELEPAVFAADEITVQGVMRGLMRSATF